MNYLNGFKDIRLDEKTSKLYETLLNKGKKEETIKFLNKRREKLLKNVHKYEERINHIDYLIYEIIKEY